jgi:hypothetical protein
MIFARGARAMWWGLAAAAALAGADTCGEPQSREVLGAALSRAEQSFLDLDDAAFRDRFNELAGLVLPCMGDLVPPDLAARYHRLMAIHLYGLGDLESARLSIDAARAAAGDAPLAGDLLAGHDLAAEWATAPAEARTHPVPEPRTGSLAFDGSNQRERPVGVPTVAQVFDAAGRAVATAYLGPRDPLPAYPAIPRRRNALIAIAAGTGAAGVAAWIGAAIAHADLYATAGDPGATAEDLDRLRGTTNALSVLGGIGIGGAIGAGTGAVLVGSR